MYPTEELSPSYCIPTRSRFRSSPFSFSYPSNGSEFETPNTTSDETTDQQIPSSTRTITLRNLIQPFRNLYNAKTRRDGRRHLSTQQPEMVTEGRPLVPSAGGNSISHLLKLILLPILLVIIATVMVPAIKNITVQTFNSIFYNKKVPTDRNLMLKKVTIGISLILSHVLNSFGPLMSIQRKFTRVPKRSPPPQPPPSPLRTENNARGFFSF